MHPDRDIHVRPSDVTGRVGGANLRQIHLVVVSRTAGGEAGGVGVPTGPARVQAEGGAGERRGAAGPASDPGHHVLAALDLMQEPQVGGVQTGLLASQHPHCGRHHTRTPRRPTRLTDLGDGVVQAGEHFTQESVLLQGRGVRRRPRRCHRLPRRGHSALSGIRCP
jgi:hypothetical protein